jgi:hypothetical protein
VHRVAREVGAALDLLDPARAGNALAGLIQLVRPPLALALLGR